MAELHIAGRAKGQPLLTFQKDEKGKVLIRAAEHTGRFAYTCVFLNSREARRLLTWLKEQFPEE